MEKLIHLYQQNQAFWMVFWMAKVPFKSSNCINVIQFFFTLFDHILPFKMRNTKAPFTILNSKSVIQNAVLNAKFYWKCIVMSTMSFKLNDQRPFPFHEQSDYIESFAKNITVALLILEMAKDSEGIWRHYYLGACILTMWENLPLFLIQILLQRKSMNPERKTQPSLKRFVTAGVMPDFAQNSKDTEA